MFVTGMIRGKQLLHAGYDVEQYESNVVGPWRALSFYLRMSFLGRTTQSAKSPTKAPAAAMALILGLLRNRYDPRNLAGNPDSP